MSTTYFGIFARRALVRRRTPMVLCLSNARSGDLHFDTSFVALHVLVREIIPNTIPTYIHDLSRISIDCLTPASRLRRSASVWIKLVADHHWTDSVPSNVRGCSRTHLFMDRVIPHTPFFRIVKQNFSFLAKDEVGVFTKWCGIMKEEVSVITMEYIPPTVATQGHYVMCFLFMFESGTSLFPFLATVRSLEHRKSFVYFTNYHVRDLWMIAK